MQRAFVDTSAWIAFANRADPDRERIQAELRSWNGRLVTSNFVFSETVTLCLYRFGHAAAVGLGDRLLAGSVVDLVDASVSDQREAWRLLCQRPDKDYSFTDCVSFVLMRRMGIRKAIALDEDFSREGFQSTASIP